MMTETRITESNLEEALENGALTEYEAKLIRKIDIEGKGVTKVAGEEQKSKGTISLQHSSALRKLGAFVESRKKVAATGELAAEVFRLLDQGKPQSYVVSRLRVDPEEVRRLARLWTAMRSEDLNNPSLPATVTKLEARLSAVETKLEDVGVTLGGKGGDEIVTFDILSGFLEGYLDTLLGRVEELEHIPLRGLYENFKCSSCGSSRLVAVRIQCTGCGAETWWGYSPKK